MARKSRKVFNSDVQKPVKKTEVVFKTAIYVRLSKEDARGKNENSIESQIDLVKQYVLTKPYLQLCEVFADNGYTGTNFDRPEFIRMMEEVKNGNINAIAVKDLSRLGRSYIEVGDYLEKIFPFMGVRFISVNDNYDTFDVDIEKESLMIAFKSLIHDAYAKDVSVKVKSVFDLKRKNGDFIGKYPPYGYKWSETEKRQFVIEDETAQIVRTIFGWKLEGLSYLAIAKRLNELDIASPCNVFYSRGYTKNHKYSNKIYWSDSIVKRILYNEVYIGNLVQGLSSGKVSYYRNIENRDDVYICENKHEPIIDKKFFYDVQEIMIKTRKQHTSKENKYDINKKDNLFLGILVCSKCGRKIKRYKRSCKKDDLNNHFYCYNCKIIDKTNKGISISETKLLSIVEKTIFNYINLFVDYQSILLDMKKSDTTKTKVEQIKKDIFLLKQNITKKENLLKSIYEDFKDNLLSKDEYAFAKQRYINDYESLKQRLNELQYELSTFDDVFVNNNKFVQAINTFKENLTLTRELIETLIDKIIIYDDKSIEILYNFRDEFDLLINFAKDNGVNFYE